ncbi:hypothetical protein FGG08_004760 [Glutinoglossum americanum]|uniref:Vegetative incompatibility protein HET-E-1 n=1 Tax=Glutinoglossum americanum TaxID=1670608 RepID=A0A9P8I523_9PEZI|nr:hypothetical protein FGG08_004760 [Glutinoglossum americanum]
MDLRSEALFANGVLQWGKLRGIKDRISNQPSDELLRPSSLAGQERGRRSDALGVLEGVLEPVTRRVSPHSRQPSRDRRTDPLGLTVLYAPEESPSVDIIFVHGLGGTSQQTWSKNRDPELFWPKNWLPLEPDICTARVLSFGYNAHYFSSGPNNILSISDFAKSLLFDMKLGKDELMEDLDIGDAYLQGLNNEDYKGIIAQIRAVLFLSTPHRGASLAETLNRILSVSVLGWSPKQYVAEINRNSHALEDINEDFRNLAPKLRIFSFYETLQTPIGPKNMILDFCSPADSRAFLGIQTYKAKSSADMREVERLLSISNAPDDDYVSLRDRWRTGTCEGVLSEPGFIDWTLSSSRSSILWVHARPGSGKSIQSSFLIDHLIKSDRHCHYFFFRYGDSTRRSPNALLRSLAFQVARDVPAFREALCCFADGGLRLEKADARTIWQKLFVSTLFKIQRLTPLYWVIDALDESESANTVIDILSNISSSSIPIRVLVMSRQTPAIANGFERCADITSVTTLCADNNIEDIRFYATAEMEYMHGSADFRQGIVNQIVERAEGNFLWVHLALKEIMQCHSLEDIKQALEEIPSGMESLYQRMEAAIARLARPSDKSLARVILTWAAYSRRPLDVAELLQALKSAFPAILDLKHTVNLVCGYFVVIDSNNRVALVHQTAREYLIKASHLPFSLAAQDAQEELFGISLSVYLDRQVRSNLSQGSLPPLYSYAATSWAYHLNYSSAASDSALSLLIKFFQGPCVLPWIQALAVLGQLKVLVFTSQSLTSFIRKRRRVDTTRMPLLHRLSDLELLELWAIDLLKLVGKFGGHLLQDPTAIYKYIPHLCPRNSVLYRQFGKASPLMFVTGLSNRDWDDCLARVSVGNEHQALIVTCSGRYLAVLTSIGTIILWDSITFEEHQTFSHDEHVFTICFSNSGNRLASYGFHTTRIWNISSGHQLGSVANPPDTRALSMTFAEDDRVLLMGSDLRGIGRLSVDDSTEGWHILDSSILQDKSLEGTFLNSPTALAFSSDATQIAVAYRGFPLTVWTLTNPRLINRCRRRLEHGGNPNSAWTGVNRVIWHPNNGEVLGIYTDGIVFKWDPLEGSHQELQADLNATPSEIQCSPDGIVFATSDVNGAVKLYNYQHFALIYQLSSEDIVTALCFSPDSRRFYDLRGSYCNIWEPNVLIRLSDIDERASEIDAEAGSTTASSYASEAWVETPVSITALSARPQGQLLCTGDDDGLVEVHDIDTEKKLKVGISATGMSIDQLIWSEDGKYFAYAELGGRITVNSIELLNGKGNFGWLHRSVMSAKLSPEIGGVRQLLLSPGSDFLLVASLNSAQLWSIRTRSVHATCTSVELGVLQKWATNPSNQEQLLAFTTTTIIAYGWGDLQELTRWHIKPLGKAIPDAVEEEMPGLARRTPVCNMTDPLGIGEVVDQVIVSQAREHILLLFSLQGPYRRRRSHLRIIDVASLTDASSGECRAVDSVHIPGDIATMIERPLDILGKDRLVFLDESFWVCTWRLTHSGGPNSLVRHFFLPRDWVNTESLDLCQVMADGTFLCPRKDEVAIIKSGLGSDW